MTVANWVITKADRTKIFHEGSVYLSFTGEVRLNRPLNEGNVIRVDTQVLAPGEVVDIFPTEQSREDWEEVQKVLGRR